MWLQLTENMKLKSADSRRCKPWKRLRHYDRGNSKLDRAGEGARSAPTLPSAAADSELTAQSEVRPYSFLHPATDRGHLKCPGFSIRPPLIPRAAAVSDAFVPRRSWPFPRSDTAFFVKIPLAAFLRIWDSQVSWLIVFLLKHMYKSSKVFASKALSESLRIWSVFFFCPHFWMAVCLGIEFRLANTHSLLWRSGSAGTNPTLPNAHQVHCSLFLSGSFETFSHPLLPSHFTHSHSFPGLSLLPFRFLKVHTTCQIQVLIWCD